MPLCFTNHISRAILIPMKIIITLLKPLSFLPALLMTVSDFFIFSPDWGCVRGTQLSDQLSDRRNKNELLNTGKSYDQLAYEADQIHYYVRKAAHMTEYFLLAIAISFPLYVYKVRGFWLFFLPELYAWALPDWTNTISPLFPAAPPVSGT